MGPEQVATTKCVEPTVHVDYHGWTCQLSLEPSRGKWQKTTKQENEGQHTQ